MIIEKCEIANDLYKYWVSHNGIEYFLESKICLDLDEVKARVLAIGTEEKLCDGN